jgi:hypothetical protein
MQEEDPGKVLAAHAESGHATSCKRREHCDHVEGQ